MISFYRGDSHTVEVTTTVREPNGTTGPVDLTGATAILSVRGVAPGTYAVQKIGEVVDAAGGVVRFKFVPVDTGAVAPGIYPFDVQITTGTGDVYTVVRESLELLDDVTR